MTDRLSASLTPLALKFSLDEYTSWWNSPQAAIWFWVIFVLVMLLLVGGIGYWLYRFETRANRK